MSRQWCHAAGLGEEPRQIFAELSQIRLVDVILPTRAGWSYSLPDGARWRASVPPPPPVPMMITS
jgi:hypothetical protein